MNEYTTKQRVLAAAAHVGYFLGGLGFFILPLVIKTIWKDDEFIEGHAQQAFYVQAGAVLVSIVVCLLALIITPVAAVGIGVTVIAVAWGIFSLVAAINAMAGRPYVYPVLKLLKLY